MSINPYESPAAYTPQADVSSVGALKPFFAWERLRIWYNLVLFAVVILVNLPLPGRFASDGYPRLLVEAAFGANACFSFGLVVEHYARWFGWWRDPMRLVMFTIGMGLSVMVTVVVATGGV